MILSCVSYYTDELDGFEENWKVNADKNIPGWNDGFCSLENAGNQLLD